MREGKLEAGLFGTLEGILPSSPASVLAMLPRLFTSFIQASRKYRSVITAQAQQDLPGDAIEHLRKAAVDFCSACLSCAAQLDDHENPWRARVALLDIVDRERLFNYQDADTETMLKNTAGIAYKCLASPESNSLTAQHFALQSLATLTRIDYDLVAPILPQLLRQMLLMVRQPIFCHIVDFLNTINRMLDWDHLLKRYLVFCSSITVKREPCPTTCSVSSLRFHQKVSASQRRLPMRLFLPALFSALFILIASQRLPTLLLPLVKFWSYAPRF